MAASSGSPVVINKSISLIGRNTPVIDGGGQGDVVTISADDVVISGFTIRGSSKNISQEPAAIKVKDAKHVTIRSNRLEDAHFGIHITESSDDVIENNVIDVGAEHADRAARSRHLSLAGLRFGASRQHHPPRRGRHPPGVLGTQRHRLEHRDRQPLRTALHVREWQQDDRHTFRDNLAGAVLMYSNDLILKDNELSSNRRGASGAGILLKDNDNIWVEGNRILRNKFGMTVDGAPQSAGATAIFRRNLFALNDTGIAVMSNAPITFVENAMIDNTVQVKALGGDLAGSALSGHGGAVPAGGAPSASGKVELPKGAVWSSAGRGNYWSDYRGFDANGDGVGDQPLPPPGRPLRAGSTTRTYCASSSSRPRSRPSTPPPICSPCTSTTP